MMVRKKKGRKEWVTLPNGKKVFTMVYPVDEEIEREFTKVLSPRKRRVKV